MFNMFDDRRISAQIETPRTFLIWQTQKEGFQNICVYQYLLCFFYKNGKIYQIKFLCIRKFNIKHNLLTTLIESFVYNRNKGTML